jgi:membrane protease YdiL (CAAX protease family)
LQLERISRIRVWANKFFTVDYGLTDDPGSGGVEHTPAAQFDWRIVTVLIVAALMLVFRQAYRFPLTSAVELVGRAEDLAPSLFGGLRATLNASENSQLVRLSYWSVWQFITYVIIPVLVVKLVLRQRLRDYGLKLRGLLRFWWLYAAMYLTILPAVIFVSYTAAFQNTYPFYRLQPDEHLWPRFCIWQCFYALQFISLEFFFRGFMVHGTKRQLGIYSIFVMMIPYCMIHFGKPLLETLGAIIAGIVLGFMSLKTRSIWLGAASHISVALTMDFAALVHRGTW